MPGVSRDLDPGATARRIARSAFSTGPAASKQPPPRGQPAIDEDPGELRGVNPAAPSPCAAPPPRALARPTPTASTLQRVTSGAPLPPTTTPTPRSDHRQLPHQAIVEDAVKKAAEKLAALSPCPEPSSSPAVWSACPPQYATTPTYYAPVAHASLRPSSLFPRPYVPTSVAVLPAKAGMQPRAVAEAVLARTRGQLPYTDSEKGNHAAEGHKKWEMQRHNAMDRPLRIRDGNARKTMKPVARCHISNPADHEIIESVAAFATKTSDQLDLIRDVLLVLPKPPRSIWCYKQSLGGGDPDGDAINTSVSIHTQRETSGSATSVEVIPHDISIELARFGSIKSKQWKTIWEKEPLIFHDADIQCAAKAIGVQVDMMKRITSILENHPGPVKYFRLDTSQIENGREQLEEWFNILRKKEVEEVVIVNCGWPHQIVDFPINDLDCASLRCIRLCFFRISDSVLKYVENLTAIDLSGCAISSQELYALVDQSKSLRELDIGVYEGDSIRINSKSLEILLIWSSTVQYVSVQNALKLRKILVAARSKKSCSVGVWICGAQVLSDVWLNVSTQSITINDISVMTDIAPLQTIRRLVLNISLLAMKERLTLLNFMRSCTTLKELTLWRNDAPSSDEIIDAAIDDWPAEVKDLSCLKLHLEVFNIKNFKGGEFEILIASAILENGSCLRRLTLEADVSCNDDVLDRVKIDLQKIVQASVNAIVSYVTGQSDCSSFFFEEV
ncbi:unnamed protein product [Urochloa decumbens]|uniref:FBD domain-containing protein n=1 Tax=Urochloa decumbens TaxID=240449 RepID=A0ABC9B6F0_9POAL